MKMTPKFQLRLLLLSRAIITTVALAIAFHEVGTSWLAASFFALAFWELLQRLVD